MSKTKIISIMVIAIATMSIVVFSNCGKDGVSCTAAVGHWYDAGCTMPNPGSGMPLDKESAIALCNQGRTETNQCHCPDAFEAAIKCYNEAETGACTSCDSHVVSIDTCLSNCD